MTATEVLSNLRMEVDVQDGKHKDFFTRKTISLSDAERLLKSGVGIGYSFADGIRSTKNFLGADFIALNIQDGQTPEALINQENGISHIGGVVCSSSREAASSRSYLWLIQLPRRIIDADELMWCKRALANYLQLKINTDDVTAIAVVKAAKSVLMIGNRAMDAGELEFLIQDGQRQAISDTVANGVHAAATISVASLPVTQSFTTATGIELRLDEISRTTSVSCPFHAGVGGTSFVSRNNVGKAYHYCSICNKTRWEDGGVAGIFSSDAFEEQLVSLAGKTKSQTKANEQAGGLRPFIEDHADIPIKSIKIQSNRYLEIVKLYDGITFIKSGKGTGKTEAMSQLLKNKKPKKLGVETVLLIGHRQSLIRNLSKRLGLHCYLDDQQGKPTDVAKKRYGVCLDSLKKVDGSNYDIIVIDEVEQVLSHFLSETMADAALEIFSVFKRLIAAASKVVVMDADLGWTSFLTLTNMRSPSKEVEVDAQFILNTWRPKGTSIDLYGSKEHLVGALINRLENGKRVFVASNSKAEVDRLVSGIEKHWKDCGLMPLRIIAITSENSVKPEVQQFIENIKQEILNYDLVLSSPSMSTGVDISFDLDESKVDSVFGIFETRINIHTDIDQQISRVRHPNEIGVWVSPARFNFETQFEVVRSDALRSRLAKVVVSLVDLLEGTNLQTLSSDFLTLATLVTVGRRASINGLRANFVEYKKRQGVAANLIDKDDAITDVGVSVSEWGKRLSDAAFKQSILTADVLLEDEFRRYQERLKEDPAGVPQTAKKAGYRYALEWFYLQPVSEELLDLDDRGIFRTKLRRFHGLTHLSAHANLSKAAAAAMKAAGVQHLSIRKFGNSDLYLLQYLFTLCPFMNGDQFVAGVQFSSADLAKFAKQCRKLKQIMEGQLDLVVRSDVERKPVSQLKQLLRHVGLDVAKVRAVVYQGEKTYIYQIDPDALATASAVSTLVDIRREYGVG